MICFNVQWLEWAITITSNGPSIRHSLHYWALPNAEATVNRYAFPLAVYRSSGYGTADSGTSVQTRPPRNRRLSTPVFFYSSKSSLIQLAMLASRQDMPGYDLIAPYSQNGFVCSSLTHARPNILGLVGLRTAAALHHNAASKIVRIFPVTDGLFRSAWRRR